MTDATPQQMYDQVKAVESNARTYARKFPATFQKGQGVYLYDVDGNRYLDILANAGTLAFGHNHPKFKEAGIQFFEEGRPSQTLDLTTDDKYHFVQSLFSLLPDHLRENGKIQFTGPAGTDCAEAAIKLCKTATGRGNIMCFHGGYHGQTQGALALMGNLDHKNDVQNLMPGANFLPFPYSYRCPMGLGGEQGTQVILNYIENVLDDPESGIVKPAAFILEAIQGEGGAIPAPIEFLQGLRKLTADRDIPLIMDEIQCGLCRSGKVFAFDYAGICPDVILLSKALGGGQPMAALVYDKKLDTWTPGAHTGTFRGNGLSMKLGRLSLDLMKEMDICTHVTEVGAYLMERLLALQKDVKCIGDVRGKGLIVGVELIDYHAAANKMGSYPADGALAAAVQQKCWEKKMIMEKGGRHGATMRFLPPLIITKEELGSAIDILAEAIKEAEAEKDASKK